MRGRSMLMLWFCLEFNLLCFASILALAIFQGRGFRALKYFIIQRLGSALLLTRLIIISQAPIWLVGLTLTIGVILKLAAAPLHGWLVSLAQDLSWDIFFLLRRTQKILPLILLFRVGVSPLKGLAFLGAAWRVWGGLILNSLKKIFIYSSILGLGWIFRRVSLRWGLFFLLVYSVRLWAVVSLIKNCGVEGVSLRLGKYIRATFLFVLAVAFLNMAGVPPMGGFYAKLRIVVGRLNEGMIGGLLLLLISSGFYLFIYLRVCFGHLTFTRGGHHQILNEVQVRSTWLLIFLRGLPLLRLLHGRAGIWPRSR